MKAMPMRSSDFNSHRMMRCPIFVTRNPFSWAIAVTGPFWNETGGKDEDDDGNDDDVSNDDDDEMITRTTRTMKTKTRTTRNDYDDDDGNNDYGDEDDSNDNEYDNNDHHDNDDEDKENDNYAYDDDDNRHLPNLLFFVIDGLDFGLGQRLPWFRDDFDQIENENSTPTRAFLAEAIRRPHHDVPFQPAHGSWARGRERGGERERERGGGGREREKDLIQHAETAFFFF